MGSKLQTEGFWTLANLMISLVLAFLIFGNRLLDGIPAEIQLHDTYFVFPKLHGIILIFIVLMTISYLVRGIYYKLNNRIINVILMPFLFIALLALLLQLNWVHGLEYHRSVVYSTEMDLEIKAEALSGFTFAKVFLWTGIIVTATMLGLVAFKAFKPNKHRGHD